MIKRAMAIICLSSMLPSAPAQATHFVVSGSGSVTNLRSLSRQPITGAFADGDLFHITVDANLTGATHWFDSDDRARTFYRVPVSFSLAVGSFRFSSSAVETLSISDDVKSLGYAIDSIYLLSLGLSAVNGAPSFDLGAPRYVQSISVAFADLTGASTNGTDLGQLRRTSWFGTPTFSYQLTGLDGSSVAAFADFKAVRYSAGVVDSVPEPTAWTMLIVGFAAVGGAMRRGRRGGSKPGVGGTPREAPVHS